jgi:fatty-acyl-CoA synthase
MTTMTHVYQLLSHAARLYSHRAAFTFVEKLEPGIIDRTISYAELLQDIHRTARLIKQHLGDMRGVVSLLLPNIPQAQIILWAAESVAIAQPLNPLLNEAALFELLRTANSRMIFVLGPTPELDWWQKALAVAARLPNAPVVYSVHFSGEQRHRHYDDAVTSHSCEDLPAAWLPDNDGAIAAYFHTGGTTGTPRLACLTHANQVAAANHLAAELGITAGDATLDGLPIFHVAGAINCALAPLSKGGQVVFPTPTGFRNPDVIRCYWRLIERYRVVFSLAIPSSFTAIAQVQPGDADISRLRYFLTGGSPVPESVSASLYKLTARPTYQMYGLTECAGVVTVPGIDKPPVPTSAGRIVSPVEAKIDSGEICVRGPMIFAGYLTEANPVSKDGWLRTGDLGRLDDQGNLFITGRKKDLIIRSGHNIDPAMIETCLESHPDVLLAAAVGWPDAYAGELPVVYVQLRPESFIDAEALREYAFVRIDERPAAPKRVFVLKQLPLTAVGKIHKPTLRALAARDAVRELLCSRFPDAALEADAAQNAEGELEVAITTSCKDTSLRKVCDEFAASLKLRIHLD